MRISFILFLVFPFFTGFGQDFSRCEVYQYSGYDSLNKSVTKTINYNTYGQVIHEVYKDYKYSTNIFRSSFCFYYVYKNRGLAKEYTTRSFYDSTLTVYHYNKKGLLKKEVTFEYLRKFKKGVDKGWGRPGGCIVTPMDYREKGNWEKKRVTTYTYDKQDCLIKEYTNQKDYNTPDIDVWEYNSQNKITAHSNYDQSRLRSKEVYVYSPNSYEITKTWYDSNGTPRHLNQDEKEYWSQEITIYKLDEEDREIEKIVTDEKGKIISRFTSYYNDNGKKAKTVMYNRFNDPEVTHIYNYIK